MLSPTDPRHPSQPGDDADLIARLRSGDEAAFGWLVDTYHAPLTRLARTFVRDRQVADEVVQETWLGVIRGISAFEGRSSLKTWLFRILTNTARKRGTREARTTPFSALTGHHDDDPTVDPERFIADGQLWAGHWSRPPTAWGSAPEEMLLAAEGERLIADAIARLPEAQRQVITLRDVDGWSPEDVCELLQITDGNQRVLLHRARAKVRRDLDDHLAGSGV